MFSQDFKRTIYATAFKIVLAMVVFNFDEN